MKARVNTVPLTIEGVRFNLSLEDAKALMVRFKEALNSAHRREQGAQWRALRRQAKKCYYPGCNNPAIRKTLLEVM